MSLFKGTSVIDLAPKDFDNMGRIIHPVLDGNKKGLIVWSAEWCGHCKALKPDYIKAASILGKSFPLFNVDCVKYSDFASKMGIKGYPTIKYLDRTGKMTKDFTADRSVNGIIDDVCSETKVCKRL